MSDDRHAGARLLERNEALTDYLDALLREVPPDAAPPREAPTLCPVEAAPAEVTPPRTAQPEPPPKAPEPPVARRAPESPAEVTTPRPAAPVAEPEPTPEPEPETPPPAPADTAAEQGPPAWSRPDFQALLFQVGRMNLAVPLVKLHSVLPWNEDITGMPNQPDWCHGVFRFRDRNVTVIDTARLVLPEHAVGEEEDSDEKAHILIVGDGRWGLVCRTVGEVVRLTPEEVKWRRAGGQRPWLAGTVLGRLCALMDTEAFADMLAEGWTTARGRG